MPKLIECYKLTLYRNDCDGPCVGYQRDPYLKVADGFIICQPEKDSVSVAGISPSVVKSYQIDPIFKEKE